MQGGWVGQEWEQLRQMLGQAGQDDEPDSFRRQPVARPGRRAGNEVDRVAAGGEGAGEPELAALHAAAAEVTHEERERAAPCRAHWTDRFRVQSRRLLSGWRLARVGRPVALSSAR